MRSRWEEGAGCRSRRPRHSTCAALLAALLACAGPAGARADQGYDPPDVIRPLTSDQVPGATESAVTFGAETDVASGYAWNGILVTGKPVVQPSAWVSFSGFTFAGWVNIPTSDSPPETDLDITFNHTWGTLTIAPEIETYFERTQTDSDDRNTTEASVDISQRLGELSFFTSHTFDVGAHRGAYVGTAGVGREVRLAARSMVEAAAWFGWASSKFNEVNIGVREPAVNFIGAQLALTYALSPRAYLRPHLDCSDVLHQRFRALLDRPTIVTWGLSTGLEF